MSKLKTIAPFAFAALFGVLLLIYAVLKAEGASFTHDESFSYLHYMDDSFMDLLSFADAYTNNHILNSIGMKYSEQLFGTSELALRLPNILALIAYVFFAFLLLRPLSPVLRCAGFALLTANVHMIDLFGLARGYGLSFGFMLMCLYFYFEYRKERRRGHLAAFHLSALLAILSNFTTLTFYAALLLTHFVALIIMNPKSVDIGATVWREIKRQAIPFLVNAAILYEPIRRLVTYNALDFGGKSGFFNDTIASILPGLFPGAIYGSALKSVALVFCVGAVLICSGMLIRKRIDTKSDLLKKHEHLLICNVLLLAISAILILQHYILGTDYPVGRFALFMYPLFVLFLSFFAHYLWQGRWKWHCSIAMSLIGLMALFSFAEKADLAKSGEWGYDSETKAMMQILQEDRTINFSDREDLILHVNWLFEPTSNFYRSAFDLEWLKLIERESLVADADYLYVFKKDLDSTEGFEVVKEFAEVGSLLLRKKR